MSSQVTCGTSTTVSRSADGLLWLSAHWQSSIVTASEFITSASIVSSSKSMRSIFFRMAWRAASEHRAARSAPTCPWVSLATCRKRGEH
ncbi:hypothetical protein FKM82_028806 [Ascaphus truei]